MANTNITLRTVKGAALTFAEMDQNFASFFYSASSLQDTNGFNTLRLHYTGSSLISGDFDTDRYLDVLLPDAQGTSGGGIGVGGSITQIQFNDDGTNLGGDPEFVFDKDNNTVSLGNGSGGDSTLDIKSTIEAATQLKLRAQDRNDVRSQSYLNITKGNTSQLQVGLIDNGSAAKPRIQATEQVTLGAGTAKMLTVYDDGIRLGSNADVSSTGKTLFVEGTFGIGPSFANAQITNFSSIANGTFDGGLGSYLPTNSGTNGLLISTPAGTTSGGVVGIGINTTSNNAESFSIFSGTNNSFNKSVATFKADGKVGIGNVNPKEVLHVNGNITGSGNFEVDGTATVKTLETGGHTDFALVATAAGKIKQMAASPIPLGGIIMWSGTVSNIPTGWKFCDGNGGVSVNGIAIPDLRNRFIAGANQDTSGKATSTIGGAGNSQSGGTTSYTPAGSLTMDKLTTAMVPRHTHMHLDDDHTYVANVSGYGPGTPSTAQLDKYGGGTGDLQSAADINGYDADSSNSGNRQAFHTGVNTTTVRGTTVQGTNPTVPTGTFNGTAATIVQPYYALAFIIYVGV